MELAEVQSKVDEAVRSFGGYWGAFELLARLTEELGEVARDLQRQHGMRPRPQRSNLHEEVGDLLFTLAAFANLHQIDLEAALRDVLEKYRARDLPDWQAQQEQQKAEGKRQEAKGKSRGEPQEPAAGVRG